MAWARSNFKIQTITWRGTHSTRRWWMTQNAETQAFASLFLLRRPNNDSVFGNQKHDSAIDERGHPAGTAGLWRGLQVDDVEANGILAPSRDSSSRRRSDDGRIYGLHVSTRYGGLREWLQDCLLGDLMSNLFPDTGIDPRGFGRHLLSLGPGYVQCWIHSPAKEEYRSTQTTPCSRWNGS